MNLYVDTSALLKRYIEESESKQCAQYFASSERWITGRHTYVETRRNLCRLLSEEDFAETRQYFLDDWPRFYVVELDEATCDLAANIAEATQVKTLDAMHLACVTRLGVRGLTMLTFDVRQAQAARTLGVQVIGV